MPDEVSDNYIICPYCTYIHLDVCDYPEDIYNQQEMDCDECKKTFLVIGEMSWTYETSKKKIR